ncbi:hypothetical protein [Subtercola endophyticus]|uniref:hypothetical protein n=1 Tax=Subtercola endophyticus TaxID=2895559 RepID=UPI001E38FF57|nr:hypothetical protein [Subtercola endophyticus]UFS57998.1 hypothetical protein LQ955_13315 [Subtercola endophyticus]
MTSAEGIQQSDPESRERPGQRDDVTPDERASQLKERVYVTFTALAVLIALAQETESPGAAALVLLVTTCGVLLAGLVADIISHTAVHSKLPSRHELGHMIATSVSALAAIAVPMILFGLAALEIIHVDAALRAGQIVLAISLGVIALGALRRAGLTWWRRLLLAGILTAVGIAAIVLEYLAHTL